MPNPFNRMESKGYNKKTLRNRPSAKEVPNRTGKPHAKSLMAKLVPYSNPAGLAPDALAPSTLGKCRAVFDPIHVFRRWWPGARPKLRFLSYDRQAAKIQLA